MPSLGLPSQVMALFPGQPTLGENQLAQQIDAFEPDAPPCVPSNFDGKQGVIRLGSLFAALQVRPEALPREVTQHTIGASLLSDKVKGPLRMHQACVVVSLTGDGSPTQRMGTLLKISAALTTQGAAGVANPETWSAYTPAMLTMLRQPGFWPRFYAVGVPYILAAGFVKAYAAPDELWFLSKGHHLYGLPDLAFQAEGHHQAEHLFDIFSNLFHWLMDVGPVVEAGHVVDFETDELRFRAPSGQEKAFLDEQTLILEVG